MFKPSRLPQKPCIPSSLRTCIHQQPRTKQMIKRSVMTVSSKGAFEPLTVEKLFDRYKNPFGDIPDAVPGIEFGDTRLKLLFARLKHFDYVVRKKTWMDKEIYLVGVAHFADESRLHIKETILNIRPDTLVLELTDKNPYEQFLRKEADGEQSTNLFSVYDSKSIQLFHDVKGLTPSNIDKLNKFESAKDMVGTNNNIKRLLSLSGALASTAPSVQTPELIETFLFAKQLFTQPDGAFLKNVVLADRDPLASFSRLYTLLPTKYRIYFVINNILMALFNRKSRRVQALKDLPDIDFSSLVEFDKKTQGHLHANNTILQYTDMFERDLLFLHALKNAPGKKIVGVFGMVFKSFGIVLTEQAHLHGILKFWDDQVASFLTTDNNVETLTKDTLSETSSVFFDLFKTHYGTDLSGNK